MMTPRRFPSRRSIRRLDCDGVEGTVHLELVVGVSGSVESARLVRGVGYGLDEAALRAARRFRFAAATKGGRPVRVRMGWSMQFRLQ